MIYLNEEKNEAKMIFVLTTTRRIYYKDRDFQKIVKYLQEGNFTFQPKYFGENKNIIDFLYIELNSLQELVKLRKILKNFIFINEKSYHDKRFSELEINDDWR